MIEWVVEASTYCNMRCAYCYQWDGLDDRTRMPLDRWAKVLRAACDYHRMQEDRLGEPVSTRIIWHGGEPLVLPLDYLRRTFELKAEIVAAAGLAPEQVTTAMQTNLYAVSDAAIDLLREHRVGFGVSFDVVRGVRLNVKGGTTEDRVLANLDRLRAAGLDCGAITVLARHTCGMILDVFDFWAGRGCDFRVLPLFAGPDGRDADRFAATETELVEALCRLFDRWIRSPAGITVKPLDAWLATVVRHLLGEPTRPYDRRRWGESVIVVQPDGSLHQVAEVGDEPRALGNLDHQSIAEVLRSDAYLASLDRSEALTRQRCTGCRYRGACDSWPAHTAAVDHPADARCHVAYRVHDHIERYLRRTGLDESLLRGVAAQVGAPAGG